MNKSDLFPGLAEISFAQVDPDTITRQIINAYENASGRTLALSDPVRLFLDTIILIIIQQRNLIDIAAKNNLIAYAEGEYLDHIGALFGVTRRGAGHASVMAEFSLSAPLAYDVAIPAGTRITPDNKIFFATVENLYFLAGNTSIQCALVCLSSGTIGNGYVPGQINRLVDVFPFSLSVRNTSESSGGYDAESDEAFRERIHIAPEHYSTAGPVKAYEYYAKSADNDIIDVYVAVPPETLPGHVHIYPLMSGGVIPSDNVIDKVMAVVSADDIRPDTDYVEVLKPQAIAYSVDVSYWIDNAHSAMSESIQAAVNNAVNEFVAWQKSKLGRDINPSELTRRIINAGAKRCVINSPAFKPLMGYELAVLEGNVRVSFEGVEDA